MSETFVNNLRLPTALSVALRDGSWKRLEDSPFLERVFGEEPSNVSGARFYDLEYLRFENMPREGMEPLLGHTEGEANPGDVDPQRLVLIADLGIDRPIALDYRTEEPRIVYLQLSTFAWRTIAESVEALLEMLQD